MAFGGLRSTYEGPPTVIAQVEGLRQSAPSSRFRDPALQLDCDGLHTPRREPSCPTTSVVKRARSLPRVLFVVISVGTAVRVATRGMQEGPRSPK